MSLTNLDLILKVSLIHSRETGISGLKENMDLILDIEKQLKMIHSLAVQSYRKGLSLKQKYLLKGTVNELREKFKYLDDDKREDYLSLYHSIGLKDLIS